MRFSTSIAALLMGAAASQAATSGNIQDQAVFDNTAKDVMPEYREGVGHFSEWCRETKKEFLVDWQLGRASDWILVQGNEGGDLDSMTAALAWAYHLHHSTENRTNPIKAIALLQTPSDALDLRPENKLALRKAKMSSGHTDLLTLDELPEDPETLSRKVQGIVVVDHEEPLRRWDDAKVLSLFDHHEDHGAAPDAKPRVCERVASCTTLVARQMLDELEKMANEYHMPHEILELMLSAIAIDSGGLKPKKTTKTDKKTAKRVLKRSAWADRKLGDVMDDLDDELSEAQEDIDDLPLRDLLRRDWKGSLVYTPSPRTPTVNLGFAVVPYSMDDQIHKTEFQELFDWFAVHAAWTAEVHSDISVTLTKYKIKDDKGKKRKIREIVLTTRADVRIDEDQADELFHVVVNAIENNGQFEVKPWHGVDKLGHRQMVWTHESDAGRKVIRPIVEKAVKGWK
ncbi:hypothetical protein MBLNU230_g3352t1 [Neophaeotheca triangularis]